MKIPPGMTEEELISKLEVIIERIAPKYTFYGYSVDDLKQEAFIICIDGLDRYDPKQPLENFISSHLSNRLKNLIRDNHFNKVDDEEKKKIKMPGQLSNESETHYYETFMIDSLDVKELVALIDDKLPYEYRANYLKLLNNVHIPKKDKEELILIIQEIAEQSGYTKEELDTL